MGQLSMSRLNGLSNDQLLTDLKVLAKSDCILEAELIAHLSEVEARRLHLEQGCSSMFDYCVNVLRFSEGVAYKRIGVARATRRFSDVGLAISRDEIHLSAASLIAPHLSAETVSEWRSFVPCFAIRFQTGISGRLSRGRLARCSSRSGRRRSGGVTRHDRKGE